MTRNRQASPHDREVNERLTELERNPLWDPVAADHTDREPQPDPVNGHIPDIVAEGVFGRRKVVEVEHRDDDSAHAQSQQQAFEQASIYDPTTEFETAYVEDDSDDTGGFLGF